MYSLAICNVSTSPTFPIPFSLVCVLAYLFVYLFVCRVTGSNQANSDLLSFLSLSVSPNLPQLLFNFPGMSISSFSYFSLLPFSLQSFLLPLPFFYQFLLHLSLAPSFSVISPHFIFLVIDLFFLLFSFASPTSIFLTSFPFQMFILHLFLALFISLYYFSPLVVLFLSH